MPEHIANKFQLSYNLAIIEVEKLYGEEGDLYKVTFSNEVPEIILSNKNGKGKKIWDSLPPDNRELAESIGSLIEEYHKQEHKTPKS